ncbi:GGDEF domain-containing protein [Micromonospora qiuiae]|uniref:GGDEF domain-containing protein n=1 Tax=Micromonospora qiuiae TaxID=502268 RepID=A0ABQ4J9U1_9ACTN|nr:bifunctional diguanylate cyclase/phosphodiesterase [Micromonospora qiuiae]GIJ26853.1 GGDEF domain-containing protein [Micromonospora qiuiae]
MAEVDAAGEDAVDRTGAQRYAAEWARAVRRLGFVPLSAAETERLLLAYTLRLADALRTDESVASVAEEIGRAMVETNLTEPGMIEWSVRALADRLPARVLCGRGGSGAAAGLAGRIAAAQGGLAAGFARALRDRTFVHQERIARSAWQARDAVEQALRDSEARFRAVFSGAAIGIGIADVDGRIIDVNQAFADMLGYPVEELRRLDVASLFHPDDVAGMSELYRELVEGKRESVRAEQRYHRKDGTCVWADLAVSLIRHDDGRPRFTVAVAEDITGRYELQRRLRFQALHDPLTELPNRTLFFETLGRLLGQAGPVGLCFLDLDGFKAINDSLGHDLGDRLLVTIARRLAGCVAERGYLVARMGGDEFAILVDGDAGIDGVIAVAEAVLAAVSAPVFVDDQQLMVSASIGIVDSEHVGASVAELMKAAHTTLYWAKAQGRGRWAVYDPERSARDIARSGRLAGLPLALDRGEFVLHYQPIVSLLDGRMLAVEALVRWQHPQLGLIGPDRFIGLAEETGLIVRLGEWVLRQACRDARGWHTEFPDARLVVSVNLAARQADAPAIVDTVADTLASSGLPAELLQLELTESAVMGSAEEPLRTLHRLAGLGVRLAIDDFGTGYSNLAYLRRLPITCLKLAAPFVEGIRGDEPDAADHRDERIVDALVRLAHALELWVTAEGVETEAQAERLRALRCDTAQGRLFGPPEPADAIRTRLAGG